MSLKKFKILSFFVALAAIVLIPQSGCNESGFVFVDCDYCYSDWPDLEEAELSISINSENTIVPITVFDGPYEDGNVAYQDTAYSKTHYIIIDTDTHFTLQAEYQKDGRAYYVISGARLKTHYEEESCTDACYYVTGKEVDLRMKF